MSGPPSIAPKRLFALSAVLVLALAMVLSFLRAGGPGTPVPVSAIALQAALEVTAFGVAAAPFAAMIHLLGGSGRPAALRAVTVWAVVVVALLLLLAGTGDALISRFGAFSTDG